MGKRKRKKSVYIALEGQREHNLFCYLRDLFADEKSINIKFASEPGGTSNAILDRALKGYGSVTYAWFDEDSELDTDHRKALEDRWHVTFSDEIKDRDLQSKNKDKRNPIIIVSTPLSVEGILIRLFDKRMPRLKEPIDDPRNLKDNKRMMKNAIDGIFGGLADIEYYRKNLTKELVLEKAKTIDELRLLLTVFDIDIDKEN